MLGSVSLVSHHLVLEPSKKLNPKLQVVCPEWAQQGRALVGLFLELVGH